MRNMIICMYDSTAIESVISSDPLGMLSIAAKYQIEPLGSLAEKHIIKSLTTDNVVATLLVAEQLQMSDIKAAAFEFIATNMEAMFGLGDDMLVFLTKKRKFEAAKLT